MGRLERQRTNQQCVNKAEHRGVGPDSERDRDDGHGGKAGRFKQTAKSETDGVNHNDEARMTKDEGMTK